MNRIERRSRNIAIARDAEVGMSVSDLVQRYHICPGTIVSACKENGVQVTRGQTKPLNGSTYDILADLFRPGASIRTIANRRGVSAEDRRRTGWIDW